MNKLNTFLVACLVVLGVALGAPSVYSLVKASNKAVNVPVATGLVQGSVKPLTPVNEANRAPQSLEVIDLTEDNTVVMSEAFNDQSVSKVMLELQAVADKSPGTTVYLVLNTPGGSVDAGLRLISFIKGLNLKVKTLTLFAASMGFMTAQNLDERLILDTGTLMSHRAKFGVAGEYDGEMVSRFKWLAASIERLEGISAARMRLSLPVYKELIRDEYWVDGQQAVTDKAADRAVYAKCGKGMKGTRTLEVSTMFGMFEVTVSKCPLIPGYIDAKAKGGAQVTPEALKYVQTMFGSKRQFVNEYVVTNEWVKFQK